MGPSSVQPEACASPPPPKEAAAPSTRSGSTARRDTLIFPSAVSRSSAAMRRTREYIEKYDIRIVDERGNVSQLSGGNAQKIIIAREFESNPSLIIASQPTRGVDVGSIEFIHKNLLDFRNRGGAVLLISSELSEIMSLSDRVIVMYKGAIIGEVDPRKVSREDIGLLMAGAKPKGDEVHG